MSTEAISAIAAAPNAPLPAEEAESNWPALGQLHGRRRNTRTVLNRYLRSVKVLSERLGKAVKESSDEEQRVAVKSAHSLLRQFYYSYNYITQARDAPRYAVPSEFEAEIKEVLSDSNFAKFEAAAKATKEEYEKELPKSISTEVADRLIKFLSVKESDHIKAKYNSVIDELTTQIDARKALPKDPKEKKPKQQRRPRKDSKASDASSGKAKKDKKTGKKAAAVPIEDQLQAILKEVSKRSSAVRFSKDDFESYSEAQHQLDNLHEETVTAILKMKTSLRKRFQNVQKRASKAKKEEKK
jgi:hypothetical protein